MSFDDIQEGDSILFNDRKTPLTVERKTEDSITVKGPKGGAYEIYREDDSTLVCKKGNKRYSSYCDNLRKTGKWVEKDEKWVHSKSNAKISLVQKENGFWSVKTENISPKDFETPKYGYTSKESAINEIEDFTEQHPEG